MSIRTVSTDQAPRPGGHYSQATVAGNLVFISGQLPIRPDGCGLMREDFETQVEQALANVLAILQAAGGENAELARVTAYIVGAENWGLFNEIYGRVLGDAKPARTIVPVREVHYGYKVEIEAIGLIP
ncbi:MAG: RidA family protein [Sphingomonadales bacterium]|nr:RidA family protein [Sphingomonadales bacterium]MDE2168186.1 RidA family protein [Sphingomonadales bacterium]